MPVLAARVGLSPQRRRVWERLRRAAEALQAGRSLADAAIVAGFADQAHFTREMREMREMMGLTPAAVLPLLRAGPAGDVDREGATDRGNHFGFAHVEEPGFGHYSGTAPSPLGWVPSLPSASWTIRNARRITRVR